MLFKDDAVNDAAMMLQMQAQQSNPMNPAAMDPGKAFQQERQALELTQHKWAVTGAEERAVKLLKNKLKGR